MTIGGPIGSAPLNATPIGGTVSVIVVNIDNTYHDVLDCVTVVRAIWRSLMTENAW